MKFPSLLLAQQQYSAKPLLHRESATGVAILEHYHRQTDSVIHNYNSDQSDQSINSISIEIGVLGNFAAASSSRREMDSYGFHDGNIYNLLESRYFRARHVFSIAVVFFFQVFFLYLIRNFRFSLIIFLVLRACGKECQVFNCFF